QCSALAPRDPRAVRQVAQTVTRSLLERSMKSRDAIVQLGTRLSRPHEQFARPGARGRFAIALEVLSRVLLEHCVEVGAAEAERADCGAPRNARIHLQPRPP